jgi:glycosyltransferase involved in cell wall biosynthesis
MQVIQELTQVSDTQAQPGIALLSKDIVTPQVSVVIPTCGRPAQLERAVRSVLTQTLQSLEVIVVLDGPDAASVRVLEAFDDPRIVLLQLARNAGAATARNVGISAACGQWIALLDDDDEFLPMKLETQWRAAMAQPDKAILVVCKSKVVMARGTCVWPERFPNHGELFCDYLFCRRSLRQGEAFLQTSTYFLPTSIATAVPFRADLARHQDWDWVIQLQLKKRVRVVVVNEVLSIYHCENDGKSISKRSGWQESLAWAREVILPQSRRAFAFFIATQCVPRLGRSDRYSWKLFHTLARQCFLEGSPSPFAALLFGGFWVRSFARLP